MNSSLALKQIDRELRKYKALTKRPRIGWIATLRYAYGMTAAQLAQKMEVTRSRITELEAAEIKDATTLRSLRNAAHAMECELVYAIVPKKSIRKVLEKKAQMLAEERVNIVVATMALENQSINKQWTKEQIKELKEELLKKPTQLWRK